ncbi:hypothetical protein [Pedobacter sp.]|jgi:hypothetical protein|uniref:hypothetical protein n=1 Tax=Pedobacter sp. TaxID=1411316 RepID=UPI002C021585|nr:hypothetical protein [Pedobacter sp.]HWW39870.1 hypothetical protein [Pedobacter sp.]
MKLTLKTILFVFSMTTLSLFSCSKGSNPVIDKKETVVTDEKIYVKVTVENGELISISSISNGSSEAQSESLSDKKSFTKEYKSVSVVNASAKGIDANSVLRVKILKGDKVLKEAMSAGADMSVAMMYF